MNDFKLNVITHDLEVEGLDMSIARGADGVRQNLLVKLKLWTGEWFLDTEFGTPYLSDILGKQLTLNGALAALKRSILEVSDVQQINLFTYRFDRAQRRLFVNFEVTTPFGLVRASV